MPTAEEKIKSNLATISAMIETGKTDKEIAKKLDVGYSTFRRYKSKDSEVKAICNEGKEKRNQEVEKALFRNATGYHFYEEVATKIKYEEIAEDGQTVLNKEDVKISNVKKYARPNLEAQKYWLNNKDKIHWKDDPHKVLNDKKLTKLKEKEIKSKVIDI